MICALREVQVPYGVIHSTAYGSIESIEEKPSFSFLINTGVYLIEPQVIDDLPEEYLHMPHLAQQYIKKGAKVGVFPISGGDWLDMGQFEEMENMSKKLIERYPK